MVGCVFVTLFIENILNHKCLPVKKEREFGILKSIFFRDKSNILYILSITFNILLKLDRVRITPE